MPNLFKTPPFKFDVPKVSSMLLTFCALVSAQTNDSPASSSDPRLVPPEYRNTIFLMAAGLMIFAFILGQDRNAQLENKENRALRPS